MPSSLYAGSCDDENTRLRSRSCFKRERLEERIRSHGYFLLVRRLRLWTGGASYADGGMFASASA